MRPGDKGANQAFAASRAGARVVMVGASGEDEGGEASRESLRSVGVDTSGVLEHLGQRTGRALVLAADDRESQIVVDQGANLTLDARATGVALKRLDLGANDVLLASFEIPEPAVIAAVLAGTVSGSAVVVNPAPVRALDPHICVPGVVLTPNASEASLLSGTDDPAAAAEHLARRTGGSIVVTRGAHGILLQTVTRAWSSPALTVPVVDTTGDGDVLSGVLAVGFSEGLSLVGATAHAAVAASLSVRSAGSRGGILDRGEIEQALRDHPDLGPPRRVASPLAHLDHRS